MKALFLYTTGDAEFHIQTDAAGPSLDAHAAVQLDDALDQDEDFDLDQEAALEQEEAALYEEMEDHDGDSSPFATYNQIR